MSNLMMSTSFSGWAVALGISCKEVMVKDRPGAVSLWGEAPVEVYTLSADGDPGD